MKQRTLGSNGPQIPVVGFGGWPIGGGMGSVDEKDAIRTVEAALEMGYTLIDTAEAYKSSQERIGRVIKEHDREKLFLATKVSHDMSKKGVEKAFENSLRTLKTDYIDLYQVHWWDRNVPVEETLEAIETLRAREKVRYIGVSNFTVEQLERAMGAAPIHSNQINYNIFLRTPEKQLFPFCREKGIGVMVHSTLAKGILTGKYKHNHQFPSNDERSRFTQYQGETFNRYIDATEEFKKVAEEKGRSLIELSIAWVLRREEITTALVGMKDPAELASPFAAGDYWLSQEESDRIERILESYELDVLSPFDWQIV